MEAWIAITKDGCSCRGVARRAGIRGDLQSARVRRRARDASRSTTVNAVPGNAVRVRTNAAADSRARYRFDRFVLTDDRLAADGHTVRLAAKPLGVLRTLVANAGRVTTKQELVDAVWDDRAVSDESIARSVFLVRQALGELDANPPRFVETVYGRGYRFVADVVVELEPRATGRFAPRTTTIAEREALNLCIEARYRQSRRIGDLVEALRLYERALEIVPDFQPARVGLAAYSLWLASNGVMDPLTAAARARAQLHATLARDPADPRAHATLGLLSSSFDWDVVAADAAFSLAIAARPEDPLVNGFAARHWASMGDWDQSRAAIDMALAAEPASITLRNIRALIAACAGDTASAVAELQTAIALEPDHPNPKFFHALIVAAAGGPGVADAYDAIRRLHAHAGDVPLLRVLLGYAAACAGDEAGAAAALAYVAATAPTRYVVPTAVALIHVARDDRDAAFKWLERAIEERCSWLAMAAVLPPLAVLRADPRFARVRAAIGR
jgi:DNA-binding winged helix-turn-helix (wHTH) protein/Flp pilus assembly protein TadD